MPSFALNTYSPVARVLGDGDDGFVGQNGAIFTIADDAISGTGVNNLTVLGSVSTTNGYNAYSFDGSTTYLTVGDGASMTAQKSAIALSGSSNLFLSNAGSLQSTQLRGADISNSDGSAIIHIQNSGLIQGGNGGMSANAGDGVARIVNSGEIIGEFSGLWTGGQWRDGDAYIANSGLIASANAKAYDGGYGFDHIVNTGEMLGDILLYDGDDVYEGMGGLVSGEIRAGDGNDIIRAGDEDNFVFGENGSDILAGRGGDDTLNGGAGNDRLKGGAGNDTLLGGGGNDILRGHAGDDTLRGNAGADTLNGGSGDDTLRGDGGADMFVFNRAAGNDTILDFENGVDQIDLSAFGIFPTQFASVVAPALSNAGGGATFLDLDALGGEGSVLIEGLSFANADASDFVL
jgi:Ca2+-binding RTX toxin-like protein